ncbi:RNA degradosome polyphosphate kinase [Lachnoclostridium sp. Marseille-P6806]|uniref:RNA degradosome polyphosphate kinase n=1 Tax=Lachnoclostridium sp. Marseille-P6806 TaxID=2364793 RepID=UPI003FA598C8
MGSIMAGEKSRIDYSDPKYYINRELSWLQFNQRVLSEARRRDNRLFERLKFLSITSSNLDEFFMVRVASLKDMVSAGYRKRDIAGMTAGEQLEAVLAATRDFVDMQYLTYNRSLLPALASEVGLEIVPYERLTPEEEEAVSGYYEEEVYPTLTPMAVDSSRPFPLIRNKTLNIGALLRRKSAGRSILFRAGRGKKKIAEGDEALDFAVVQVPSGLPRIRVLPSSPEGGTRIILLEEIIRHNMPTLFLNYDVVCCYPFRLMRNADLSIDEDEAEDLLKEIEKQLKRRQWGEAIRLEVEDGMDDRLLATLERELAVQPNEIFRIDGPLDLTFLMKMYGLPGFDGQREHRYAPPQEVPEIPAGADVFEAIRRQDIFMHHPYESFQPVVNFVAQAAVDPAVLAIKQTLYRVSGNSPIIMALARAAENGKQVMVLVELKARFDEEHNIGWAKTLEKAGCHVIYGLVGLKTHSKITLVVRREEDGIRRYVHLATGNYNDSTAKLYTDVGLFTCKEPYGEDATAVFNMLSGYSEPRRWNRLSMAPLWLKDRFLYLIGRERDHARAGEPAHIIAKMNSLCDPAVMEALYEASAAGVKIELIVRGICCLRVGIPGVSENITVRSIVGNYLEHSRIFYFENGGRSEVYAASADWMPRNLDRRVELMFPLEDEAIREKAYAILCRQIMDTEQAQVMTDEGVYERVDRRGRKSCNSQLEFSAEAVAAAQHAAAVNTRIFVPEMRPNG